MALSSRVGNTPLLQIRNLSAGLSPDVRVFAKAEWFNPAGSIKDRTAVNIIRTAIAEGKLTPGKRLLDSTSGNMGIAYATYGIALGVPVTLCLPANASPERIIILRALGAELVLTDASRARMARSWKRAGLRLRTPTCIGMPTNTITRPTGRLTTWATGPEILAQTDGTITHLVVGLGTSGTMMGTGRYLREKLPDVKIIAVQPDAAFHGLEGLKHMLTAIQPAIYEPSFADRTVEIRTEAAHDMVRALGRQEGLFVGISSGAAMAAALQVAAELKEGTVVTIFPDAGYKYLSDRALWEG